MGAWFEKSFIRGKNACIYESWVSKAAKDIGRTSSAEGKGVPVEIVIYGDNSEWFGLESPILETEGETAEKFIRALSREFKAPVLRISCCDSDFAVCRVIDGVNGSETAACINEPYEVIAERPTLDTAAWTAACKKKWKCNEKQFEEVFSGEYVFAEDGLFRLADIIQLPKEALNDCADDRSVHKRVFWIIPEAESEAVPIPRTLSERLADYIEDTYADKLTGLGYKRFGGSSLRWHKVFGEESKELVSSIVFVVRYNAFIEIFFGSQAVCCPLVLSDKYFPLHVRFHYLFSTSLDFKRLMGFDPCWSVVNGIDNFDPPDEPDKIAPYLDALVPEVLEKIACPEDLRSLAEKTGSYELFIRTGMFSLCFAYRMFVDALLAGDEAGAADWAKRTNAKYYEMHGRLPDPRDDAIEDQMIVGLPQLFLENGAAACMAALKKVRDSNMKRLKRGGVV